MKLIVSALSPDIDSAVDPRFGRAACFVLVDVETLEWTAFPNPGAGAMGGAGTQAAQHVVREGTQAAASGDFGPNAYGALNAAGIAMYLLGSARTVREAVEFFKAGRLDRIGAPTQAGHRS